MKNFNGILNNNGYELAIRISLDLDENIPYVSNAYISKKKIPIKVDYNEIIIDNIIYHFKIKRADYDEILIIGKELPNMWHFILPCLYQPKYFVLTNKQEV